MKKLLKLYTPEGSGIQKLFVVSEDVTSANFTSFLIQAAVDYGKTPEALELLNKMGEETDLLPYTLEAAQAYLNYFGFLDVPDYFLGKFGISNFNEDEVYEIKGSISCQINNERINLYNFL